MNNFGKHSGLRLIVIAAILTTSVAPNFSPHRVRAIASALTAIERQGSGASTAGEQAPSLGKEGALASVLNADGTLNIESATGENFDVSGYRMETTGLGAPRFVPQPGCGPGTGTWDTQFKLPNGVNGPVFALAVSGSDLFVGGVFTAAGNVAASCVARFNTTTNTWSALGPEGSGVIDAVYALAVSGSDLYVGGFFPQLIVGGTIVVVNSIARFSMVTNTWNKLGSGSGSGVNDLVYSLEVIGDDVFAGGSFTEVNVGGTTTAANHIAKFNTLTNAWSALGSGAINGVNAEVGAFAVIGSDLYVGGAFSPNNGVIGVFAANYIAKYSTLTNSWSTLGSGSGNGINGPVGSLAVKGSDLYAGGHFTQANAGGTAVVAANNIVRYNTLTSEWSTLGSDGNGVNGAVQALALSGDELFVSGIFTQTNVGGTVIAANHFARFRTTKNMWSPFGTVIEGQSNRGDGKELAVSGGSLYVGGIFGQATGGGTTVFANNIARFDPLTNMWSALAPGPGNGVNGEINALAVTGNHLYVGGSFTAAGNVVANNIAGFDLTTNTWSALGLDGNGVNHQVNALAVIGNDLYVGGFFFEVNLGGTVVTAFGVARYNTVTNVWGALGSDRSGVNGDEVYTLAVIGDDLYVGGFFSELLVDGQFLNVKNIARFNTTTNTWSALGTGPSSNGVGGGFVFALALVGDDLFVGGSFNSLGNIQTAAHIARYNTTTNLWSTLGSGFGNGVTGFVHALAVIGSDLYVGGSITRANVGGTIVPANRIVRYNTLTNTWSPIGFGSGNGVNTFVRALAVSGSGLYVGGFFTTANVGGATVAANNIVRFNTADNTWSALGLPMDTDASPPPTPQITCPDNITKVAPPACTPATGLAVSYPDPTVNCAGVSVACSPSSGSLFPVGTTTVTCTASDAGGNSAACSFTVSVFSLCLQDDSNSESAVLFNPSTGEYRYCCNGVVIASGRGAASVRGCTVSITHNEGNRRVLIKADTSSGKGTATLQVPLGQSKCTITDRNMSNNNCDCS